MNNRIDFELDRPNDTVLVVGGGVGGQRAALDLAEAGLRVVMVEMTSSLGGRVAQLGFMFPTHDCVLCRGTSDHGYGCTRPTISPAFADHNTHPNILVLTNTEVTSVRGQAGDFTVQLRYQPRYVDPARCTNCGLCEAVCPAVAPSGFQGGLSVRKAIYKSAPRAQPNAYVVDRERCEPGCRRCEAVCPTGAVQLDEQAAESTLHAGAIILAAGYRLFNPQEAEEFGFGRYRNVITSMQYERLASRSGPTEGKVMRISDSQPPGRVAWLQCVGSRNQDHPYCSTICCMYATKQAMLTRQRLGPDVEARIFSMDERAFSKEYNAYFEEARDMGVRYTRCRVSGLREDPQTNDLIVRYVPENGTQPVEERFGMVVLSVGTEPPREAKALAVAMGVELNEFGFCMTDKFTPLVTSQPGVYVCGTFSSPKEIAETIIDAAGAAGTVMQLMHNALNSSPVLREYPFLVNTDLPPERDVSGEPVRTGVFVCRCEPTIESAIDTAGLVDYASRLPGVAVAERVDYACFPEGQALIQDTIEQERLNRVVMAGCSNRTHEALYQRIVRQAGLNPYLLSMVNLREQCAWVHLEQPERATRKAGELVRMAVARASALSPVRKQSLPITARALVIGGGVAGMTAALTIADAGYDVTLVERDDALGGNLRHIYYVAEGQNPQRLLRDLINRVRGHPRIELFTRAEVVEHKGSVGQFHSLIRSEDPPGSHGRAGNDSPMYAVDHGVTIVATGGQQSHDGRYLLGQHKRVIEQQALEDIIAHHPEDIATLKQVVMIQCVRPEGALEYCSRICCTNTMKNAIRVKLLNPACQVIVMYKDIITYGFREQYYTEARSRGVIFVRYTNETLPQVKAKPDDPEQLEVRVWEPMLKRELVLEPDMLALSMAVVPSEGTAELAHMLHVPLSTEGFYLEAHLKMRPMDFMAEGIFVAGMAHYPKFIEEAIANAQAAAGRALTLLSKSFMYVGGTIAVVDQDRCVGCLTCVRTCPFEIPQVRADVQGVGRIAGAAWIDPALCQGCGTCTSECPASAIQLANYRDEQMLGVPDWLGAWVNC
ncbi:MAG: CoB--CoM heterodisulfide reductase iron-sulfur subunit A family protein [Thermoflexales bacterium]|nr:CoB--CoM heterodisulfide reductase iron-sulfur subunit A family protein [Thermoflexales bacterium]